MRKSQIDAMALNAMRDAMAAGKSEADIIRAGQWELWQYPRLNKSVSDFEAPARAIYDKHFVAKEPN